MPTKDATTCKTPTINCIHTAYFVGKSLLVFSKLWQLWNMAVYGQISN